MNDVAFAAAVYVNYPTPRRVTTLQQPEDYPAALSLSAIVSQYFTIICAVERTEVSTLGFPCQ
jgi:hypothetical protein